MSVAFVNCTEHAFTDARTQHHLTLREYVPFQQIGQFQYGVTVGGLFPAQFMEEQYDKDRQRNEQYHNYEYEYVENERLFFHYLKKKIKTKVTDVREISVRYLLSMGMDVTYFEFRG